MVIEYGSCFNGAASCDIPIVSRRNSGLLMSAMEAIRERTAQPHIDELSFDRVSDMVRNVCMIED